MGEKMSKLLNHKERVNGMITLSPPNGSVTPKPTPKNMPRKKRRPKNLNYKVKNEITNIIPNNDKCISRFKMYSLSVDGVTMHKNEVSKIVDVEVSYMMKIVKGNKSVTINGVKIDIETKVKEYTTTRLTKGDEVIEGMTIKETAKYLNRSNQYISQRYGNVIDGWLLERVGGDYI